MTTWLVLIALIALFTWAVRRGPSEPPFPYGYDGERQIAELRGLTQVTEGIRLP